MVPIYIRQQREPIEKLGLSSLYKQLNPSDFYLIEEGEIPNNNIFITVELHGVAIVVCSMSKSEMSIQKKKTSLGDVLQDVKDSGVAVWFDINHKDFVTKIYNVLSLKNGDMHKVKHKDIIIFEKYQELVEESDYDSELKRIVGIIEGHNTTEISSYRKPRIPTVIFTTGHKAKGLEWDNVILASDFPVPLNNEGEYYELPNGEINLLYVCLTRAQKVLQTNKTIDIIVRERKSGNSSQINIEDLFHEQVNKITKADAVDVGADNT